MTTAIAPDDPPPHSATHPAEDNPGRGKNGQFIRDLDTATKDALAARLRATGAGYKAIAAKLGYSNESGAYKAVQRALAAVPVEGVTELRGVEAARLDMLTEKLWDVLSSKYPHEVGGRTVVDQHGQPVGDPAVIFGAVDRLARLSEQRARLLGLNVAPARTAVEPKLAALELTGHQVAMLQRLLQALSVEPADAPARLALAMVAETSKEAA